MSLPTPWAHRKILLPQGWGRVLRGTWIKCLVLLQHLCSLACPLLKPFCYLSWTSVCFISSVRDLGRKLLTPAPCHRVPDSFHSFEEGRFPYDTTENQSFQSRIYLRGPNLTWSPHFLKSCLPLGISFWGGLQGGSLRHGVPMVEQGEIVGGSRGVQAQACGAASTGRSVHWAAEAGAGWQEWALANDLLSRFRSLWGSFTLFSFSPFWAFSLLGKIPSVSTVVSFL